MNTADTTFNLWMWLDVQIHPIKDKEIRLLSAYLEGLVDTFHKNICVESDIDKEEALFDALTRDLC